MLHDYSCQPDSIFQSLHQWTPRNLSRQSILALHGFTGNGADFQIVVDHLPFDFTVIAPNLPGHLNPSHPSVPFLQLKACCAQLATLASRLPPPRHLLAYSMGGRIAWHLLLDHSGIFTSATLIGSTPGIPPNDRQHRLALDRARAAVLEKKGLHVFLESWQSLPLIAEQTQTPLPWRTTMSSQRLMQNDPAGLALAITSYSPGALPSRWPDVKNITIPIALAAGQNDPKFQRIHSRIAAEIPTAHSLVIPSSGHAPHFLSPYFFTRSFANFISRLSA